MNVRTIGQDEQFAFKRALSRLIEMTSSSYIEDETWSPLPASSRKWEARDTSTYETVGVDNVAVAKGHGYQRPEAPRISADHIWGVREDWAEGAHEWGKGAKVFAKRSTKSVR